MKNQNNVIQLTSLAKENVENYYNYTIAEPFGFKVEVMLDAIYKLTNYSLIEIKNYFTLEEAAALCDVGRGAIYHLETSPRATLYLDFRNVCEYELYEKWRIDKDKVLDKIYNLTEFQAYIFQLLIIKFWEREPDNFNMKDIAEIFYIDYDEVNA